MTAAAVGQSFPVLIALTGGITVAALVVAVHRHLAIQRRRQAAHRLRSAFLPGGASTRIQSLERRLNASLMRRDPNGLLARLLTEANVAIEPAALVLRVAGVSAVVVIGALLVTSEPLLALFGAALVPVLAYAWLLRRRSVLRERLLQQLPDALTTISNALLVGASLPQAIEQATSECPTPVRTLLGRVTEGHRVGRNFEEVMTELSKEVRLPMLEVAVAAMLIHRQAGGSLGELLADAADLMREDLRLQRDLRVATAQAKLSAQVVGALPIILVVLLSIASPSNLEPFFSSLVGKLLFAFAGGLEIMGFFLVVRASSVDF